MLEHATVSTVLIIDIYQAVADITKCTVDIQCIYRLLYSECGPFCSSDEVHLTRSIKRNTSMLLPVVLPPNNALFSKPQS